MDGVGLALGFKTPAQAVKVSLDLPGGCAHFKLQDSHLGASRRPSSADPSLGCFSLPAPPIVACSGSQESVTTHPARLVAFTPSSMPSSTATVRCFHPPTHHVENGGLFKGTLLGLSSPGSHTIQGAPISTTPFVFSHGSRWNFGSGSSSYLTAVGALGQGAAALPSTTMSVAGTMDQQGGSPLSSPRPFHGAGCPTSPSERLESGGALAETAPIKRNFSTDTALSVASPLGLCSTVSALPVTPFLRAVPIETHVVEAEVQRGIMVVEEPTPCDGPAPAMPFLEMAPSPIVKERRLIKHASDVSEGILRGMDLDDVLALELGDPPPLDWASDGKMNGLTFIREESCDLQQVFESFAHEEDCGEGLVADQSAADWTGTPSVSLINKIPDRHILLEPFSAPLSGTGVEAHENTTHRSPQEIEGNCPRSQLLNVSLRPKRKRIPARREPATPEQRPPKVKLHRPTKPNYEKGIGVGTALKNMVSPSEIDAVLPSEDVGSDVIEGGLRGDPPETTTQRCHFLFSKRLTLSDVGPLNRIILPRAAAEAYFPSSVDRDGRPMHVWTPTGERFSCILKFWLNGRPHPKRMWLLDGCADLIKGLCLHYGSCMDFYASKDGRFVVAPRK